jgi:hypothetical protein
MLGIHIKVTAAWRQASSRHWVIYAADVSRRDRPEPNEFQR